MFARVAKAGHLVLTTQLALELEPIVKKIFSCFNNFQVLQCDVFIALGLIVAVYLLQMLIK